MTKRTSYEDLTAQLERLNMAAMVATLPQYQLEAGPAGGFRLVDHKGRGVIGSPTAFGMAAIPRRELLQRMSDFTLGIDLACLAIGRRDKAL